MRYYIALTLVFISLIAFAQTPKYSKADLAMIKKIESLDEYKNLEKKYSDMIKNDNLYSIGVNLIKSDSEKYFSAVISLYGGVEAVPHYTIKYNPTNNEIISITPAKFSTRTSK